MYIFVVLFRCVFYGTRDELDIHMGDCKFEPLKDFLQKTENKMAVLSMTLGQKEEQIEFLTSMLGQLSARVEDLEKSVDIKFGMF